MYPSSFDIMIPTPNLYIIITSGGSGQRMGTATPKQFLPIEGIPILCRTFRAFEPWVGKAKFIVTLPADHINTWKSIDEQYRLPSHEICVGGETRFHSVKNALEHVPEDDNAIVLVHDGVRPLVLEETINEAILTAQQYGSAIPYVPITASLRRLATDGSSEAVDRNGMVQIQTPQAFNAKLLKEAYQQDYRPEFTDDATVYEAAGHKLFFFEDSDTNIKITTPSDIAKASFLLKCKNASHE
jgi:2-C-methyl-D-erythritol 4-phosphate cytidylyltransferase